MKTSSRLINYFQEQSDAISRLLRESSGDFRPEDFHLLRIHIKKIKAIFSLTAYCVEGFDQQKYFKPYKAIFQRAGAIREMQLQEMMMKKYKPDHVLADYYHQLDSAIRHECQLFSSLVDKKLKRKLKNNVKSTTCFMKNVVKPCVKDFLLEKRSHIEKLLHCEKLEISQAHELRKRIKEVYYLQKIVQPKNKRLAIADDFQELLGQWHDHDVIRKDLINDAQNHKLKPEEVKAIMAVQKKITGRGTQLFLKIESEKAKTFASASS
jgi:CHAD domain-containing protein